MTEALCNSVQSRTRRLSYRARVHQQFCQTCRREGRWLEFSSDQASVNYYRCAEGHVWIVPKDDPQATPTQVTPDAALISARSRS